MMIEVKPEIDGFLTSNEEVNNEFYNLFLEKAVFLPVEYSSVQHPHLQLQDNKRQDFNALIRYYNRGDRLRDSEIYIQYPVISFQNFTPEPNKEVQFSKTWLQGNFREEDGVQVGDIIYVSTPMLFRYQVSIASQYSTHQEKILDWFYRNFYVSNMVAYFLFNKIETENLGDLGIPVPYIVDVEDVPREDGIFESVFNFTLKPCVQHKLPVTMESIEVINALFSEMTPDQEKHLIFSEQLNLSV